MAFRYWYKNDDGDLVEFTDRVQTGWAGNPGTDGLVMQAEEGGVGQCTLKVEDPEGDWDFPRGHRIVFVVEDEAEYDEFGGVVFMGYTWIRRFKRDLKRTGAARIVEMDLVDINTVFDRRIMTGSDAKRPAESDVERITWALSTNEAALIDDQTYFSTDGPVDMDANDYRGMSFRQIFDDCSLQSGKNWYLWPSLGGFSIWYGPRGTSDFSSDILISNVLEDVAEYSGGYAPAIDSDLTRDPSRVYSGIYRAYSGSNLYIQNEETAEAFARRDTFASSPTVKTKTQALIRSERELSDISSEEDVIKTSIVVPRSEVNCVVPGQRVQVRYTHFPGYETDTWVRVLKRTVRELAPAKIELAMELSPEEPVDLPSHTVFGVLVRPKGYDQGNLPEVWYQWVGDFPETGGPRLPTVGLIEALSNPSGPLAPTWDFYGWKMLGSGTVDVEFNCSTISITADSVDFMICINGVPYYTFNQTVGGVGKDCQIRVEDIPVVTNDILTTRLGFNPSTTPFSQAPRGVGTNNEFFKITGGFLA